MTNTVPLPATEATELAGQLRAVIGQLRRRFRQVDNAEVLTPTQSAVLGRLDRDGSASQAELAAAEHVRQQSMAATLGALDELGYIKRSTDPHDGRRKLISLSELGEQTVRGLRQHHNEWLATALADTLSARERTTLATAVPLLRRLAEVSAE